MDGWRLRKLTRRRPVWAAVVMALLLLAVLAGGAYAALQAYSTPKYALVPGGLSTGGSYALQQAAGEAVVGTSTGGGYTLCAGYLCGAATYKHYLPLGMK